jgi:hypothetical protein
VPVVGVKYDLVSTPRLARRREAKAIPSKKAAKPHIARVVAKQKLPAPPKPKDWVVKARLTATLEQVQIIQAPTLEAARQSAGQLEPSSPDWSRANIVRKVLSVKKA